MLKANSKEELVDIINRLKKGSKFKGFSSGETIKGLGVDWGSRAEYENKFGWTNRHFAIEYKGIMLDAKVPMIAGTLMSYLMYIVQKQFNDGPISYESPANSMGREFETLQMLQEQKFPTFKPIVEVNNVLLTKRLQQKDHSIDAIKEGRIDPEQYLKQAARLLYKLHKYTIWSEAWMGNTLYSGNKLFFYDFGYKANPNKGSDFLKAKDIISFMMSAVTYTGLTSKKVVTTFLDGYAPDDKVKGELDFIAANQLKIRSSTYRLLRQKLFFDFVYALKEKTVMKTYRDINNWVNPF